MNPKVITIVGAGPGISLATAERFAQEGFSVAFIARNPNKLSRFVQNFKDRGLQAQGFTADASQNEELQKAIRKVHAIMGPTHVLLYNAAVIRRRSILKESVDDLAEDFRINVGGALAAVQGVHPEMKNSGSGCILLTGGGLAINPWHEYGSLAIGKAGIRNLALQLAQALEGDNIRVHTLTVSGHVTPTSEKYSPSVLAEIYWDLYQGKHNETEVLW